MTAHSNKGKLISLALEKINMNEVTRLNLQNIFETSYRKLVKRMRQIIY